LELYEQNLVKEYWIVSPQDRILMAFDLNENNKYQFRKVYTDDEKVPSSVLEGFELDMNKVFLQENE
jgi:Uma2 family endonuclease